MEAWRLEIGPFSHRMLDELEKKGIFPTAVNVVDRNHDPMLQEDRWAVRLQLGGEDKLGKRIIVMRSFIEDSLPEIIGEIIYRVHTTRNFRPIIC